MKSERDSMGEMDLPGRSVREVAEAWELLSPTELDAALDVHRMTEPGLNGS